MTKTYDFKDSFYISLICGYIINIQYIMLTNLLKVTIDLAFKKEKKRGNKILINKAKCIIVAKLGEKVTG